MKVAIACPGLGRIRQGFETFAKDLFRHLLEESDHDVVLFKGGGKAASSEFVLWNIPRRSSLWRLSGRLLDPYIGEQLTFTLSLARRLKREAFDIVHVSDCQVASLLAHLIHGERRRPRILYSNGGPYPPDDFRRFDFIQQVNPVEMERATAYGINPARMMLVPYAVDVGRFRPSRGTTFRGDSGIPEEALLVLTVGPHGGHKRLDFLVRDMGGVRASVHLLVVGQPSPQDASLKEMARRALGSRVSFATFPHVEMPGVYASADLYVHAALFEGFGLALLEAMACGLPIVHHDDAGMNWLVNDGGVAVDMPNGAALSEAIRSLAADPDLLKQLSECARRRAEEMFSWDAVLPQYTSMYREAVRMPPNF